MTVIILIIIRVTGLSLRLDLPVLAAASLLTNTPVSVCSLLEKINLKHEHFIATSDNKNKLGYFYFSAYFCQLGMAGQWIHWKTDCESKV